MVQGFCNANWGSSPHHHSISGYSFHMRNRAISWSLKKQYITALLSTKVEYIALTHTVKEAPWLHTFLSELWGAPYGSMTINCDNKGAIVLSKDNKFHVRTKHIDIHYHFIHDCVGNGKVLVKYILSKDNILDIFTKALPKQRFTNLTEWLGLWLWLQLMSTISNGYTLVKVTSELFASCDTRGGVLEYSTITQAFI